MTCPCCGEGEVVRYVCDLCDWFDQIGAAEYQEFCLNSAHDARIERDIYGGEE